MTRSGRGRAPSEHRPPAQPLASRTPYSLSLGRVVAAVSAAPPPAASSGADSQGSADPATRGLVPSQPDLRLMQKVQRSGRICVYHAGGGWSAPSPPAQI